MTFLWGDRPHFGLHYRDRCPEKWYLKIENFMRLLARSLTCAMWPPEAHEFDTPGLDGNCRD